MQENVCPPNADFTRVFTIPVQRTPEMVCKLYKERENVCGQDRKKIFKQKWKGNIIL